MLTVIRTLIAKYETYGWITIIVTMMALTWRSHSIWDKAQIADEYKASLAAQQAADKKQFDVDLVEAKKQAKIDQKNEDLNNKVDDDIKIHPTNCPLPISRVQLINAAASRK